MKKYCVGLIALFVVLSCCGCAPKTEYDDMEVSKIESSWVEGFAPFPRSFVRTFDFKTGSVTDTWVADTEYLSEDESSRYNTATSVTTFSTEQAQKFIEQVKMLGFYTWKENYATTDIICDGGSESVTIYFSNGVVKTSSIYYKYPPNYKKVCSAFENYLGAALYLSW